MEHTNIYAQECLAPLVYAAVGSKTYSAMRSSFRASALNREEEEGEGFHTGHTVVYNDVVHQHKDCQDSGYCVIFCTGSFQGGHFYLPELDMGFL